MKEDYIKIDPQDINSVINMLSGNTERELIINYIKEYVYNPSFEKQLSPQK